MAGCGYVCPQCEGRGFTEHGEPCDWCNSESDQLKSESDSLSSDNQ